jgi:hypothetical protein
MHFAQSIHHEPALTIYRLTSIILEPVLLIQYGMACKQAIFPDALDKRIGQ